MSLRSTFLFQATIREAGLNPHLFDMANIRDQCSWVHMKDPKAATKKAKDLTEMAVAKARLIEPSPPISLNVVQKGLVIGGGLAGMISALAIADQGYDVYLIEKEKVTCQVSVNIHPSNRIFKNTDELKGYEIHMGRTELRDEKYMFEIIQREEKQTSTPDGFISEDGRVWGTYIHGIFDNDGFRQEFIKRVKQAKGISVSSEAHASFSFQEFKEAQYDRLAELVRNNIDMEAFYRIAGLR